MRELTLDEAIYNIEEEGEVSMREVSVLMQHFTDDFKKANGDMIFITKYKKAIIDFLIFKLATVERETAEKCAAIAKQTMETPCHDDGFDIAYRGASRHILSAITQDFKLGE